jgi:hypothetical protein
MTQLRVVEVLPALELLLLPGEDVAEVADAWQNHFVEEGVGLSIEEELMQAWADRQEGVRYCGPVNWAAVIDERWGW